MVVIAGFLFPSVVLAEDSDVQKNLDLVFVLVSAALVFIMQGGFIALETGLTRAKNTINVAGKNICDFFIATATFIPIGVGLMFGHSYGGWFGIDGFFLPESLSSPTTYAFVAFQLMFCSTAATIVSGAVAERMKFMGYLILSIFISVLIYPVFGHWVWGSAMWGGQGWLEAKGFIDFAGSTVVHSIGAWVGLAGALMLGPRIGRFDEKGKPVALPGHSMPMAATGTFILFFGWFGFNCGSALSATSDIAVIFINTTISASISGCICMIVSILLTKKVRFEKVINGALGGLVGITAGCAIVSPHGAILIGLTSALIVYFAEDLLIWLKVDDPVSVVAVHGFCGAWGTVALALFGPEESLNHDRLTQVGVQLLGVGVCFVWAFTLGFMLFYLLKKFDALRVSPEDEIRGLNISEHDAVMGWDTIVTSMHQTMQDGDLKRESPVEMGTEVGFVAQSFNSFLADLRKVAMLAEQVADGNLSNHLIPKGNSDLLGQAISKMLLKLKEFQSQITLAADKIKKSAEALRSYSGDLEEDIEGIAEAMNTSVGTMQQISGDMDTIYHNIDLILSDFQAVAGSTELMSANITSIESFSRQAGEQARQANLQTREAVELMNELNDNSSQIGSVVKLIEDIAGQTRMLALNSTIEASKAGQHGMGFSVVAQEIKKLAQQTSSANQEIGQRIQTIQNHTSQLSTSLHTVNLAIDSVNEFNTSLMHSLSEQSKAASEINQSVAKVVVNGKNVNELAKNGSRELKQASTGSQQIANKVDSIKNDATLTRQNSLQLLDLAEKMDVLVAYFKVELPAKT